MNLRKHSIRLAAVVGMAGLTLGAVASGPPTAFQVTPSHPSAKAPVRFSDRSAAGATAWLWMFGDGTTSTQRNPTHVYDGAGVYPVTLRVTGPSGATTESTSV